jgi:hypothetical protein
MRTIRIGQDLTNKEWNRRMGKCNDALKSAVSVEPTHEYRWEVEGIGQGHYTTNLKQAIQKATVASIQHPTEVYRVEQFRPSRCMVLRIIGGNVEETGGHFNVRTLNNVVDAMLTNVCTQ